MTQADVDAVKVEFESYRDDVKKTIGGLQQKDADLQAQIDVLTAAGNDTAALQALAQEIRDEHATLNPPTPPTE